MWDLDWGEVDLSAMLFASNPKPVREAITRHRQALDRNPVTYLEHNNKRLQNAARAAAGAYFGVPMEQVRVTWHPHEGGPLSMLDVQLKPEGESTRVEVYHEGKGIAGDPRGDWQHWQDALQRFTSGLQ